MQAENLRDYCFKEMMWKSNGMVLKVMLIKNMRPFIRICSRSLMIPVWIAGNQPGTDRPCKTGCQPGLLSHLLHAFHLFFGERRAD